MSCEHNLPTAGVICRITQDVMEKLHYVMYVYVLVCMSKQ